MKILVPEFKRREEGEPTFTELFNSPEVLKIRQQLVDAIEAEWKEECRREDEEMIKEMIKALVDPFGKG